MENEEKNLSEEGLGDILEEQGKALTETLKEQQNPQDPNTVEKELEDRAKKKELKKKLKVGGKIIFVVQRINPLLSNFFFDINQQNLINFLLFLLVL